MRSVPRMTWQLTFSRVQPASPNGLSGLNFGCLRHDCFQKCFKWAHTRSHSRGSLGRSQFVLGGAGWSSLFWIAFCSRLIGALVLTAGVWRPSSAATTGGGLAVGAYWKAGRLWVRGHGRCCWGFVGGVRCVLGRRS